MRPIPKLYLGTMTFGWTSQTSSIIDKGIASELVKQFIDFNNSIDNTNKHHDQTYMTHHIDTARVYAGGDTEQILGDVLKSHNLVNNEHIQLAIGTKAHPSQEHGLSPKGIKMQLETSLQTMNVDSVHEYYLHQPDTKHSLLDSLKTCNDLVNEGKIQKIGLSNYHVSEVERAFKLCEEYNLHKPTVYQGLYNPLNRMVEQELLPLLKQNDCSFVAYNPLAAGLLTGKHTSLTTVQKGRFNQNPNYLPRFYTQANFDALHLIQNACQQHDLSLVEATFRWMTIHSALDHRKDAILIGASSMKQLIQNLAACVYSQMEGNDLPPDVLEAFQQAWDITNNAGCFKYWRSFSSDMPGDRDSMDHGASYTVKK